MNDTFQHPGRWHDVILTPTPRSSPEPSEHIMSFHLRGLQPSSVYEGIVQAKNRYGWNEVNALMFILIYPEIPATSPKTLWRFNSPALENSTHFLPKNPPRSYIILLGIYASTEMPHRLSQIVSGTSIKLLSFPTKHPHTLNISLPNI